MGEKFTEFGRIRKNPSTEIVIRIVEYKGTSGLDIREYVTSDRYTGWSKSGIRFPLDQIDKLREILDTVANSP